MQKTSGKILIAVVLGAMCWGIQTVGDQTGPTVPAQNPIPAFEPSIQRLQCIMHSLQHEKWHKIAEIKKIRRRQLSGKNGKPIVERWEPYPHSDVLQTAGEGLQQRTFTTQELIEKFPGSLKYRCNTELEPDNTHLAGRATLTTSRQPVDAEASMTKLNDGEWAAVSTKDKEEIQQRAVPALRAAHVGHPPGRVFANGLPSFPAHRPRQLLKAGLRPQQLKLTGIDQSTGHLNHKYPWGNKSFKVKLVGLRSTADPSEQPPTLDDRNRACQAYLDELQKACSEIETVKLLGQARTEHRSDGTGVQFTCNAEIQPSSAFYQLYTNLFQPGVLDNFPIYTSTGEAAFGQPQLRFPNPTIPKDTARAHTVSFQAEVTKALDEGAICANAGRGTHVADAATMEQLCKEFLAAWMKVEKTPASASWVPRMLEYTQILKDGNDHLKMVLLDEDAANLLRNAGEVTLAVAPDKGGNDGFEVVLRFPYMVSEALEHSLYTTTVRLAALAELLHGYLRTLTKAMLEAAKAVYVTFTSGIPGAPPFKPMLYSENDQGGHDVLDLSFLLNGTQPTADQKAKMDGIWTNRGGSRISKLSDTLLDSRSRLQRPDPLVLRAANSMTKGLIMAGVGYKPIAMPGAPPLYVGSSTRSHIGYTYPIGLNPKPDKGKSISLGVFKACLQGTPVVQTIATLKDETVELKSLFSIMKTAIVQAQAVPEPKGPRVASPGWLDLAASMAAQMTADAAAATTAADGNVTNNDAGYVSSDDDRPLARPHRTRTRADFEDGIPAGGTDLSVQAKLAKAAANSKDNTTASAAEKQDQATKDTDMPDTSDK